MLLLDLVLPDLDGLDVLRRIKILGNDTAVIMISAHGSVERTVEAMKEGAENFVTKPIDINKLEALVETIGKYVRAQREIEYYRRTHSGTRPLIGVSEHTQKLMQLVDLMAENSHTTVLLLGESGTGKGVMANLIHGSSKRKDRPFVEVSCAELTHTLLESELFGHERGAFTDAKQQKKGLVEVADGGTLFLDEIGELDLGLQPKLLKFLESKTFRRVGGVRDMRSDVRIIAATNVNLEAKVKEGLFREDLYYRLKVMPVKLLPLRDRCEDIIPLAQHFVAQGNRTMGRRVVEINEQARAYLQSYGWPGNIRELRNVVERAMIFVKGGTMTARELPSEILAAPQRPAGSQLRTLAQMEQDAVSATLKACNGNRSQAARCLGISRSTLREKMKRYQLS